MKVTTSLTTLVAAGAIGLSYAQTTGGTYQTPQQAQMGSVDGTPQNNSNMNNARNQNQMGATPGSTAPQTQATPSAQGSTTAPPQLPPQADRN